MKQEQTISSSSYVKIGTIITIFLFVLGGGGVFLFKYYQLYSQVSVNVDKNLRPQEVVDLSKLSSEYQNKSEEITSTYIAKSLDFLAEGNLSSETKKTREGLLSLKVPAEVRAKHLAMVLMLEEIDRLARENNLEKISQKLDAFKMLVESEVDGVDFKNGEVELQ